MRECMCVVRDECPQEMRWYALEALLLALVLSIEACGPGRGAGRRRLRKLIPLVFKQHVPNVSENTPTASGLAEGRIDRNNTRFRDLVPNYNQDIIFKDEEGTGADRLMTQRCKEKLNTLAISVMNQWPGVHLRVTEGWDEEGHHASDSLHYEGRAVDITTSDRDRSKYGMLARLAVDAGFDWVYYESRAHIHCSVKSESAEAAKYGGCFSDETVVTTPTRTAVKVSELKVGEQVLAFDPATKKFVFSHVMLFLDWDPLQRRDFVEVQLESGKTLTLTPTHLVVKGTIDFSKSVFAETLVTGDTLLVRNNDTVYRDRVVNVTRVFRTGVYAPLTDVGTIVANDVIVSCYAVVNSHYLAHWVFIPVRLTHNLRDIFYTILQVVSDYTGVAQKQLDYPSRGVHWYPDYIYRFTKNFIPFDIIH